MSNTNTECRENLFSSKQAAIKGMWRYYNTHIRVKVGGPLVSECGTVLQWSDNCHTEYLSVTTGDLGQHLLIKSWIE